MKRRVLGSTGLEVSELCIGTLPMGPVQANIPVETGSAILLKAAENGVNFFDTAQMYRTYPYLKKVVQQFGNDVVISSKCASPEYKGMEEAITEALRELGRDYIDIFLLHAARVDETVFEQRAGALEALVKAKEKGYIRFAGISSHHVAAVAKAASVPEIDIVYPIINKAGIGILGGGLPEMLNSIETVRKSGKGMFAMKALAGGHLVGELLDAIGYVRAIPGMEVVSVGVVKEEELDLQLRIFNGEKIDPASLAGLKASKQLKIVPSLCKSCWLCVDSCPNGALSKGETVPHVDKGNCVLCGYCTPACPQFAIRLI